MWRLNDEHMGYSTAGKSGGVDSNDLICLKAAILIYDKLLYHGNEPKLLCYDDLGRK